VFLVCVFSVEEIGVVGCGCNRLYRIVAGLKFCSCSSFCFCVVRLMSRLVVVFGFAGRLVAVFFADLLLFFFADLLLFFFFFADLLLFFLQISCCFLAGRLQISCCFRFLLSFAGRLQISSLLLSDCRLLSLVSCWQIAD
jgi:hypothetical protein